MAKVLIVEDDSVIADGMAKHLEAAGFDPVVVGKGDQGLARLRFERPDVCVLDLMLPGRDGWSIIESARAEGIPTPIVVVSARGTEHDRVHALEIGADDYLVKPFSMNELVARVRAASRRALRRDDAQRGDPIEIEELLIDPREMQAFVDGFAAAGFAASAFCPSYGLAEATLAVSLMPPGEGIRLELVEENELSGCAPETGKRPRRYRAVVNCGKPVSGMEIEVRGPGSEPLPDRGIGKVFVRGASVMHSYFRDEESTRAALTGDGWLDTGDMGYMSGGYIFIVGRAKDMIIINGRNHWPQDIEWAVEQLPGFKSGDIAAFAITGPSGEETPAVLVHCRVSDAVERGRLRDEIRERVRAITGMNCVIELVPPRSLPRTSSGKLSRAKARNLYLSGEIQTYDIAA